MKESVDQLVSMWAPRWPLHNGAIYEVQSQDRPNWFSRPRGRSQSTRKRQHGCHAQPPAPPFQRIPEPMITGCKYDGKPGWQHIPRMSQEVDLWWATLEHWGGVFTVERMGHEHWATECLRKWSWSNIFWGAGALYVRKLWKMRRSSCQVERLRPFAYLWENTSLDRRYLHWPGISWHSCSGDKCFYSQAASPSQTSHATITLDSAAWSIFTDPFYNWQTSLDRNVLSTSTRSTENSLSVVTTYFGTLSAKSIVPVWGDQLSWKPDWGAFCFCHHRHDHHHHYLDFHQLFGS